MEIGEFEHVGIVTRDMEKSAAFYTDFLGFKALPPEDVKEMHMKIQYLVKGKCTIELLEPEKGANQASSTFGLKHVAYHCDNIDEVHSQAKKRGISLLHQIPVRHGKLAFFFCTGPDGEFIEFIEKKEEA
jgi:catechol 2,3-dioxygenase-like lactoylglutathione lyase family enzyme